MIFESLAETSEELMEKFFAEEPFTSEEMETALNRGLCSGDIAPVFCGSAVNFAGLRTLLNYIASSFASPVDRCEKTVIGPDGETTTMRRLRRARRACLCSRRSQDAFGKKTYFKVMNGTLKKDAQLIILTTGQTEKISRIVTPIGKTDRGGRRAGLRRHRLYGQAGQHQHQRHPRPAGLEVYISEDRVPAPLPLHGHFAQGEGRRGQDCHRHCKAAGGGFDDSL